MSDHSEEAEVKIADFGFSKVLSPNQSNNSYLEILPYCAPEILLGKPSDKGADLWALGVTIYALLCGTFPFFSEDPDDIVKQVV